jgi:thiol-disulfide isomerase/thioredoxin
MTNLVLIALMQVSALGANQGNFDQAYQLSLQTNRPLVVLIGAVWCPACQKMKNSVLPQVAEAGGMNQVIFVYLDFDKHKALASQLSRGKPIPQLIRFERSQAGWKGKRLTGAKSPREVYNFIKSGVIDISKVSASNRSRNASQKPAPGETFLSGETAKKSRTGSSSAEVSNSHSREAQSSQTAKADGFF